MASFKYLLQLQENILSGSLDKVLTSTMDSLHLLLPSQLQLQQNAWLDVALTHHTMLEVVSSDHQVFAYR